MRALGSGLETIETNIIEWETIMNTKYQVTDTCIYVLHNTPDLTKVYEGDGKGKFMENRQWVYGTKMLRDAEKQNLAVPVVFSSAEGYEGIVYCAILTKVTLGFKQTVYEFENLKKVEPNRKKSELTLLRKKQPLSESDIRSYRLCVTPSFVVDLLERA
jgi:hypothetical protein